MIILTFGRGILLWGSEIDLMTYIYHSLMPKLFDTDNSAAEDKRGNPRILYQDRNI